MKTKSKELVKLFGELEKLSLDEAKKYKQIKIIFETQLEGGSRKK